MSHHPHRPVLAKATCAQAKVDDMIAAIYARIPVATLFSLLALVSSASGECAWMLWERPEKWVSNDIELKK